jgi:hypothetical protein
MDTTHYNEIDTQTNQFAFKSWMLNTHTARLKMSAIRFVST